jgi:hypothetical protein
MVQIQCRVLTYDHRRTNMKIKHVHHPLIITLMLTSPMITHPCWMPRIIISSLHHAPLRQGHSSHVLFVYKNSVKLLELSGTQKKDLKSNNYCNPFVPEHRIAHFWAILSPCYYVNARMSIASIRAFHRCLRGSRTPTSQMSNRRPQWEDGAGLATFRS